ncbi:uncharacterized protein LOC127131071 [Lathyrus oleraceus]|uniref:uncharacterized protein LOC127131071 n=1 Tax=Pisum sativum TaxID=3888 RepID=UPI0021CF4773|nr:uncharacterized protein LOC127131071 [Pisum sativum]
MKKKLLFRGVDESLKYEVIDVAFHMHKKDVISNLEVKGNTKGFPLKFLIERAYSLMNAQSWKAYYAVIALAIYEIFLFPNLDDFIDMTVISIFLTKNQVPTLLDDVYYYLSWRHEKKGWMIACCSPLLYKWMLTHLSKEGPFMEQKNASWTHKLGSLLSNDISWYYREYDGVEIISSYGDFPNIPLIETQGCVNYNLVLSMRQLGYPMEDPPEEKPLEALLLSDLGIENPALFKTIKKSWENIFRKGKVDLGKKNYISKQPYLQWIKDRVRLIKMSFKVEILVPRPEP